MSDLTYRLNRGIASFQEMRAAAARITELEAEVERKEGMNEQLRVMNRALERSDSESRAQIAAAQTVAQEPEKEWSGYSTHIDQIIEALSSPVTHPEPEPPKRLSELRDYPSMNGVPVVVPEFVDPEPWVVQGDGWEQRLAHPEDNESKHTPQHYPRSAAEYEADQNR